MTFNNILEFVLSNGNISQQYIIKRDILNENILSNEMQTLQDEIINSKPVIKMIKSQNDEGWFGEELHGVPAKAMDSTVGVLHDLGVEPFHDFMKKAKMALKYDLNPDPIKRKLINTRGYNFSRCAILGDLQDKNDPIDEELVNSYKQIISNFNNSLSIKSLDEISKTCTRKKFIGHRAYLKGESFPWISDFIVLSKNLSWKNNDSLEVVNNTINKISNFMPIPVIFDVADDGHYVAPICGFGDFAYENPIDIPKGGIVFWIRDFTRICKTTDISKNTYFYIRALKFAEYIKNDNLIKSLTEIQLKALEKIYGYYGKWKNETMQKTDIYYLALLLLNEAGIKQ